MKKILKIVLIVLVLVGAIWAIYYNYSKNAEEVTTYKTVQPESKSIEQVAVATGEIKPKEEIEIKPNISGIIDKIYANEGDVLEQGQMIASIQVVPDVNSLNMAKQQIRTAKIALENETKNFNRVQYLYDQGVIAKADYDNAVNAYQQAKANVASANENYRVAESGVAPGLESYATTQIRATISGMILDIPVETGNMVQPINNFSTGTTVATMADVNKMIFEGMVDESEVGKLEEGMPLTIKIGALPEESYKGTLYFISPSGVTENGVVQFEIKANVLLDHQNFIRAGYSANAEIAIAATNNSLSLLESVIQYDEDGSPYVEVQTADGWEKKSVKLGVSDGLYVQVLSGVSEDDQVKVWNTDSKVGKEGDRRPRN
ncbi:efflux RND transporter periplasmic adaptor subunit [Flavobacteriaceae bacterium Ap0902]|nr:efflux RND transporter periplasmic adaptor subunit [Flavobacteriaceae bacterium Ap0902]